MLNDVWKGLVGLSWVDWSIILLISVPLSMFLYLVSNRYHHDMLVDLGQHKWIINRKDK